MSWTEERVELLRKLWGDGLSAAQVAAELGPGITRNAVIGKIHRLGLAERAKTSSVPRPRAPRTPRTQTAEIRAQGPVVMGNVALALSPNAVVALAPQIEENVIPISARVTLMELREFDVPLAAWRSVRRGIPLLRSQIARRLGPVLLPAFAHRLPARAGQAPPRTTARDPLIASRRLARRSPTDQLRPNVSSKE